MSIGEIPLPWPAEINLSRPAMQHLLDTMTVCPWTLSSGVICELDNFRNMLQNLLERLPETGNLDLVGG
jgi:hypothetical protein